MADDKEVKGTRGFIVTTEPTKEAKDLVAQYLVDKNNELRQYQAEREMDVPRGRDVTRSVLDRESRRGDAANPMLTKGVLGYKRAGINPGEAEIAQREKYTYRGPIDKSVGTDDEFVTSIYNKYLGRDADPTGFQYWTNKLASGDSRDKVEKDMLYQQEAQEAIDARVGGARGFISKDFLDKFKKTGSGVKYGDYLQDKDDMDSVTSTTDSSTLNLKSLSDAYKDYDDDEGDDGNVSDFLKNYLADLKD